MKDILVGEVYKLSETGHISVPQDTSLQEVITRFAHQPDIRAIFIVDAKQRFAGTIRRTDLLKWLNFNLFGKPGGGKSSTGEVLRIAFASKAKDLARGDWSFFGVKASDTIETALDRMIGYGDAIIPVLDDEGKIVGDLRLTDILLKTLELFKESP